MPYTTSTSFDRPFEDTSLHHSYSDSNCYRFNHHKRLQKRHSAISASIASRSPQQDTLRPQQLFNNTNSPTHQASSFNPVTHHIFHDHNHHPASAPGQSGAAVGAVRTTKTRGLFRRVTRKVIEWIRGSITSGTNKVTAVVICDKCCLVQN